MKLARFIDFISNIPSSIMLFIPIMHRIEKIRTAVDCRFRFNNTSQNLLD